MRLKYVAWKELSTRLAMCPHLGKPISVRTGNFLLIFLNKFCKLNYKNRFYFQRHMINRVQIGHPAVMKVVAKPGKIEIGIYNYNVFLINISLNSLFNFENRRISSKNKYSQKRTQLG